MIGCSFYQEDIIIIILDIVKYTIASKCIKYKMIEIKVDKFTIRDKVVIWNKSFFMKPE